jgi:hypothetical protein
MHSSIKDLLLSHPWGYIRMINLKAISVQRFSSPFSYSMIITPYIIPGLPTESKLVSGAEKSLNLDPWILNGQQHATLRGGYLVWNPKSLADRRQPSNRKRLGSSVAAFVLWWLAESCEAWSWVGRLVEPRAVSGLRPVHRIVQEAYKGPVI